MLDDEIIVEEHINYVYIEKNTVKSPCTGQINVISAELGTTNLHYHLQFKW
jgi:hypothetical protein